MWVLLVTPEAVKIHFFACLAFEVVVFVNEVDAVALVSFVVKSIAIFALQALSVGISRGHPFIAFDTLSLIITLQTVDVDLSA